MKQPLLIPILHKGEEAYQLIEPWSFFSMATNVVVPKGFIADGASVPRALWPFMPPDGTHRAAALAHDWLYANKGYLEKPNLLWERYEADDVFLELMLKALIKPWRANIAFRGVRLGGWLPWRRSTGVPTVLPVSNLTTRFTPHHNPHHLYAS